jgi:glycolate oxidase iron-sulfur subunit
LPAPLRRKVPARVQAEPLAPLHNAKRRVLILDGCVQPGLAPDINLAVEKLLQACGIAIEHTPLAGCCGAVPHHLSDTPRARDMARHNIDIWYPALEAGAEALLVSASGCGAHLQDYPHLLADDAAYADKAAALAAKAVDPIAFLASQDLAALPIRAGDKRVAVHTPCTLQHALKLNGRIESAMSALGYALCQVEESHLCCGSAGTYSILQADLSAQLQDRKVKALTVDHPDVIVTANIGCLMHLDEAAGVPVRHWATVLADDLDG